LIERRYTKPASSGRVARFDSNSKHSLIRAYAGRLEYWQDGRIVGSHTWAFGRDKTVFDPLHYIPVLSRKPGALRNGAPSKEWDLPVPIRRVWRKPESQPGGDR